jgi:hypothetical protein
LSVQLEDASVLRFNKVFVALVCATKTAAWCRFLSGTVMSGGAIVDPLGCVAFQQLHT